jgi:hypothetical protein
MGNVSSKERRQLSRGCFDEDPPPYDKEQPLYPDGSSINTQKAINLELLRISIAREMILTNLNHISRKGLRVFGKQEWPH